MARRRVTKPPRGRTGGFGRSARGGPKFGRPRPVQFDRGDRFGRENEAGNSRRDRAAARADNKTPRKVISFDLARNMGKKVSRVPMDPMERWWRVLKRLKAKNKKTTRPIVLFYYRYVIVCVFFYPDRPSPCSRGVHVRMYSHIARMNCSRERYSNASICERACVLSYADRSILHAVELHRS